MSSTKITLIRHGETEWNRTSRWQGQSDVALSAVGKLQAQRLAERFQNESATFTALYSSDLHRALETAEIIGAVIHRTPIPNTAFRELDVGKWSGLFDHEVETQYPEEWRHVRADEDIPRGGAENMAALYARATRAFNEVVARHSGENVAIVTHNGVIRVILVSLMGRPVADSNDLGPIQNCSLTMVAQTNSQWMIERINDTAHLDGFAPPPDLLAL